MANKKITDLNYYSSSQVTSNDLLFITDIAHQETKRIGALDHGNYVWSISSSIMRSGSFSGSFIGTATSANNLNYPNNSTASYAVTASYANKANSSSYAVTASYALNGGGNGNIPSFSENVTQPNHGFSVGDAVYMRNVGGNQRTFTTASSIYQDEQNNPNITEVIGIVQNVYNSTSFTVVYSGIINFSTIPSYMTTANSNFIHNGYAYFLSGSNGKLDVTDPSLTDGNSISKPILLQLSYVYGTSASALIINQRGVYNAQGQSPLSASYLYYTGDNFYNGRVSSALTASYALTAAYAQNGGNQSSTIYNNITQSYYLDTTPIGSIILCASSSVPPGYLRCDGGFYPVYYTGSNINKPTPFAALYNAIKNNINSDASFGKLYNYVYNTGNIPGGYYQLATNGKGNFFNVPDLRGVFVRGYNSGESNNGSVTSKYDLTNPTRGFGSLQTDAFASHTHNIVASGSNNPSNGNGYIAGTNGENTGPYTYNNTTNPLQIQKTGSVETRPVNIALNYYIKYTNFSVDSSTANLLSSGGYPLTGDVGGSLTSSYIVSIQGNPINAQQPQSGSILVYDGKQWLPTNGVLNNTVSTALTKYNVWRSYYRNGVCRWGWFTNNWTGWRVGYKTPFEIHNTLNISPNYSIYTHNGEILYNSFPQDFTRYWYYGVMFGIQVQKTSKNDVNLNVSHANGGFHMFTAPINAPYNVTHLKDVPGTNYNSTISWTANAGTYNVYFVWYNFKQQNINHGLDAWIDGTNVIYNGPII